MIRPLLHAGIRVGPGRRKPKGPAVHPTLELTQWLRDEVQDRGSAEAASLGERRRLQRLLQCSEYERRVIGYEIHDGLAQYLAASIAYLQAFEVLRETDETAAARAYENGMALLRQGLSEARRLIGGDRPAILEEEGVEAALEQLVLASQGPGAPPIEFRKSIALGRLESAIENAIYWVAQTALANACQHSKSPLVRVSLARRGRRLVRLEIRDWGIGFDATQSKAGHFGLEGIRVRARLLGGQATIDSVPGKGTRILVELPFVARTPSRATRRTAPRPSGSPKEAR